MPRSRSPSSGGFGTWGVRTSRSIDWIGALLLTLAAGAALVGVSSGGVDHPWGSPLIVSLLVGSLALSVLLVLWERRVPEPFVPLGLLGRRAVASAEVALFAIGGAAFGAVAFVPLFVQGVLGESATRAGAVLTPFMLSWIGAGIVAGQLVSRTGRPRPILLAGPPIMGVGFALLASMDADTTTATAIRDMILVGIGIGLMMQTLVIVVQNAAPQGLMGIATASAQFSRWIGASVGVTAMGAIVAGRLGQPALPSARPSELAGALHPAFAVGVGLAAVALAAMIALPHVKLRMRFDEQPSEVAVPARAR